MSRARVHEVSSPISLFPFIGILLCTMGALLVVLVAVSRSARNTAQRQVEAKQQVAAAIAPVNDEVHQNLEKVTKYISDLGTVRAIGEKRLRDEQARLRAVEDHIRRLHERIESLKAAAVELEAMEREHYDDRQQAEREVQRLNQLIADSQKTVESLRESSKQDTHSYAVVPYEGPNGTFRRPIFIECVKNECILQPEGTRLTANDMAPPVGLGPGNPLATALRAARDYYIRLNPEIGESRDLEPYPVLLVRPDSRYDRALNCIAAGDFDVGLELVENDWKLKF